MKRFLLSLALLATIVMVPAANVAAFKPITTACQAGGGQSALCSDQNKTEPIAGTNGIIARATNLIAIIAGVAAIIVIVISAISFATADGDTTKASNARKALIGAVVGLVIVVAARSIINLVIARIK
jgi:hypothetical protein